MEVSDQVHPSDLFSPWERGSGFNSMGGWVSPTAGLEVLEKQNKTPSHTGRPGTWTEQSVW
jgi:hypothetical protein